MGSYTTLDYQSDILAIPVEDGSYDGVICTEVLEHVPEPSRALLEIGRILKVGGIALISAPLGSRLHQLPYHYYGGFTPQWYQRFLPQAWFAIESIEPNGGFFAHFAQEAQKFHALLDPRRMRSGPIARMSTALLWLGMAPTCRVILPKTAVALDGLDLESEGTVGYHVVARRIDGAAQKGLADLVCP
jgi:SAM-dependent methyltransferase